MSRHEFCVAMALRREAEVCRDRASLCRDRASPFGVATQPVGVATRPGLWVVSQQARAQRAATECPAHMTAHSSARDRAHNALDSTPITRDSRIVHTTNPTTVHYVMHCLGYYAWTLLEHCSWTLFNKKGRPLGIWGVTK